MSAKRSWNAPPEGLARLRRLRDRRCGCYADRRVVRACHHCNRLAAVCAADGRLRRRGTFLFRTIDDCEQIAAYAKNCKQAAVIGGGLLGLEAARGLMTHGVKVTILEAASQLMIAQLDPESGQMLRGTIEAMGIAVKCETITTKIVREHGRITRLDFKDGTSLATDMVVVSAGIRPITEIATASGLSVNKGIVCR